MKRKLFFFTYFLLTCRFVFSQELPLYNQYLLNNYYVNPAVAGSEQYGSIRLTERLQWAGAMSGTPRTGGLSIHSPFGKHNGLGGIISYDKSGIMSNIGAQFTYAFHSTLFKSGYSEHNFSVGVSGMVSQVSQDQSGFSDLEINDPAITGTIENTIVPDASIGAYFYSNRYYAGISVAQLLQYFMKTSDYTDNDMYFFVQGGYRFTLNHSIDFEPSLMFKKTTSSPLKTDINAKMYFNKRFWLAASYRIYIPPADNTNNSIIVAVGFQFLRNAYCAYAFDYTTSSIMSNSFGNHEIMIGLSLDKKSRKGQIPCPAYYK